MFKKITCIYETNIVDWGMQNFGKQQKCRFVTNSAAHWTLKDFTQRVSFINRIFSRWFLIFLLMKFEIDFVAYGPWNWFSCWWNVKLILFWWKYLPKQKKKRKRERRNFTLYGRSDRTKSTKVSKMEFRSTTIPHSLEKDNSWWK